MAIPQNTLPGRKHAPTIASLRHTVSTGIRPACAHLFRSYDRHNISDTDLPFVKVGEDGTVVSDWSVPELPKDNDTGDQVLSDAYAFGTRAAGALIIYLARKGTGVDFSLTGLLTNKDFLADQGVAKIEFLAYLERFIWTQSQALSPAQIAADVEAAVAENAILHLEDLASMAESKAEEERNLP